MASEKSVECEFCDKHYTRTAYKSCVECEAHFCHTCLETCHSRGPYKKHSLVNPSTLSDHVPNKCPVHQERLKFYCVPCAEVICLECNTKGFHLNHETTGIADGKQCIKECLQDKLCVLTNINKFEQPASSHGLSWVGRELWRDTFKVSDDVLKAGIRDLQKAFKVAEEKYSKALNKRIDEFTSELLETKEKLYQQMVDEQETVDSAVKDTLIAFLEEDNIFKLIDVKKRLETRYDNIQKNVSFEPTGGFPVYQLECEKELAKLKLNVGIGPGTETVNSATTSHYQQSDGVSTYQPTCITDVCGNGALLQHINAMKQYSDSSAEEVRLKDYNMGRNRTFPNGLHTWSGPNPNVTARYPVFGSNSIFPRPSFGSSNRFSGRPHMFGAPAGPRTFGFGLGSTGGLFGQPGNQPSAGGSFGQPSNHLSTGGSFGQPNMPPSTQSGGLFGQPSMPPSTSASFGQPSMPPSTGTSFGQPSMPPSTGTSFGQPSMPPSTGTSFGQPSSRSGGLFGQPSMPPSTGASFGQPSMPPSTGASFGQPSSRSGGLFGQPSMPPSSQTSASFGQPSMPPSTGAPLGQPDMMQPSTGTLFGQPSSQTVTGASFGQPSMQPYTGGPFGQASAQPRSNLFLRQPTTQPSTGGLFGQARNQATTDTPFSQPSTQVSSGGPFGQPRAQTSTVGRPEPGGNQANPDEQNPSIIPGPQQHEVVTPHTLGSGLAADESSSVPATNPPAALESLADREESGPIFISPSSAAFGFGCSNMFCPSEEQPRHDLNETASGPVYITSHMGHGGFGAAQSLLPPTVPVQTDAATLEEPNRSISHESPKLRESTGPIFITSSGALSGFGVSQAALSEEENSEVEQNISDSLCQSQSELEEVSITEPADILPATNSPGFHFGSSNAAETPHSSGPVYISSAGAMSGFGTCQSALGGYPLATMNSPATQTCAEYTSAQSDGNEEQTEGVHSPGPDHPERPQTQTTSFNFGSPRNAETSNRSQFGSTNRSNASASGFSFGSTENTDSAFGQSITNAPIDSAFGQTQPVANAPPIFGGSGLDLGNNKTVDNEPPISSNSGFTLGPSNRISNDPPASRSSGFTFGPASKDPPVIGGFRFGQYQNNNTAPVAPRASTFNVNGNSSSIPPASGSSGFSFGSAKDDTPELPSSGSTGFSFGQTRNDSSNRSVPSGSQFGAVQTTTNRNISAGSDPDLAQSSVAVSNVNFGSFKFVGEQVNISRSNSSRSASESGTSTPSIDESERSAPVVISPSSASFGFGSSNCAASHAPAGPLYMSSQGAMTGFYACQAPLTHPPRPDEVPRDMSSNMAAGLGLGLTNVSLDISNCENNIADDDDSDSSDTSTSGSSVVQQSRLTTLPVQIEMQERDSD